MLAISVPVVYSTHYHLQGMNGKDLAAPKYTGIAQTMFLVTKEEGPLALWKGNGANVLRVIPVYGLKFAFNDSFKAIVAGPGKKKLSTSELLWVGTWAGLFQTVITYPLETIRTRLSLGPGQGVAYKGIIDCCQQMVRTEGWAGL
jgi:solute carrier family 25 (adenine nucleotide translocator) protein 4/5/6/31